MSPELEALGRRAVAAPGWRWLPGMRATRGPDGWRLRGVGDGLAWDPEPEGWGYRSPEWPAGALPDLSDAATVGCLLALVRERRGLVYVEPRWDLGPPTSWEVYAQEARPKRPDPDFVCSGPSEAEALVAALEAP